MPQALIRDAGSGDFPAILALNDESVRFLSPLDAAHLRELHAMAAYHRVVEVGGKVAAFLLALREGADYASPNYRWFAAHHRRFLYIDRVVVATAWQGRGLGARLYDDIIAFAGENGFADLTCEFDLEPPNPASAKFHARYGFREVGRQWLGGGGKQVSLQVRTVAATAAHSPV
jgi:predicted GNAT superfamily acetyltransferase